MTAVIAAAYFAVTLPQVGGLSGWWRSSRPRRDRTASLPEHPARLHEQLGPAVAVFIMPIAVQWWAVWYPGPSRAAAATSRSACWRRSPSATRWARCSSSTSRTTCSGPGVDHHALCSIIVYPQLSDIQAAFPHLDPSLLGHDIGFPAMLKFLPVGFIG